MGRTILANPGLAPVFAGPVLGLVARASGKAIVVDDDSQSIHHSRFQDKLLSNTDNTTINRRVLTLFTSYDRSAHAFPIRASSSVSSASSAASEPLVLTLSRPSPDEE